jgi:hypothetical protein
VSAPSDFAKHELWRLVCGDVLGQGVARTVYEHRLDPCLVVKVEEGVESFQNVAEWQAWQEVQHTEFARWFAPCVAISPCGGVLVQRRTTRAAVHPERIPNFLSDTKLGNFGILRPRDGEEAGRFVCHDYGLTRLMTVGLTRRMVKANWWNQPHE